MGVHWVVACPPDTWPVPTGAPSTENVTVSPSAIPVVSTDRVSACPGTPPLGAESTSEDSLTSTVTVVAAGDAAAAVVAVPA